MESRKPFKIKGHYKHDFRDWIRDQFPGLNRNQIGERLDEVHAAAMSVLDITMARSDSSLQKYYAQDLENLRKAHEARDVEAYAAHLSAFVGAIEVE